MSNELSSALVSLGIALLVALASELRQWARNKQAKADKAIEDAKNVAAREKLQQDNAEAQAKIKADAESAQAQLKADQERFVLQQAQLTSTIQAELNTTKDALAAETRRSNGQQQQIGELTEGKNTAEKEMIRLRDAKINADRRITELESDLNARSQINNEMRQENTKLIEERAGLVQNVETLRGEVATLRKKIEDIELEHKAAREEWQKAEIPRQQTLSRVRYALREAGKLLTDDQRAALDKQLTIKDTNFALLSLGEGEAPPPDADERVQQLRQMIDFQSNETRALITLLSDRGVSQQEIDKVLQAAREKWRPPDSVSVPLAAA